MKYTSVIIAGIITISQLACTSSPESKTEPVAAADEVTVTLTPQQIKNAGIEVGSFTDRTVSETIRFSGMVDVPPQNIVSVSFPLGGYLKSTKLLPGMHVSKGESIAIIEDQSLIQLQQDYLVARAKLNLSKLEYERQKSLNETKTASDKIFQNAEAEYESNRVLLMGLGEKLRLININPDKLSGATISRMVSIPSTINGFVSKVNVNIGKYVQPQDILFELINPSDIHAVLTVFEKDLNKIKKGQKVMISFVDEPERLYEAEVILITRNVDENRSGMVHCHFEKLPENLKPGMYINASLYISASTVKALPEEAIVRYESKEYIFQQSGTNVFELVPIKTGRRENNWVEVLLATDSIANKPVVVRNAFAVLSKMKNVSDE